MRNPDAITIILYISLVPARWRQNQGWPPPWPHRKLGYLDPFMPGDKQEVEGI